MSKNKKLKKAVLVLLIVFLALVLLVSLLLAVGGTYLFNRLGSEMPDETVSVISPEDVDFETDPPPVTQPPTNVATQPTEGTESTEGTQPTQTQPTQPPATEPPPPTRPNIAWPEVERLQSDDVINILLVGKDASASDGRPRTDSMIVLSLNKKTKSLSMVSLMRDLYVQIPNIYSDKEKDQYDDNRINAAYRIGGIEFLNATIEKNFGIVIDGNVEVDFRQFEKIIDILGGVDIELTAAEAKYLTDMEYYGTLEAGLNRLDGKTALEYCRIRMIDSDHQRTERQRKVLQAVAAEVKDLSVTEMLGLVNGLLPYVQTDMSAVDIIRVTTECFSALKAGNGIRSGKVPQSGHYYSSTIMGMQVLVPNLTMCNQYLKAFIYG